MKNHLILQIVVSAMNISIILPSVDLLSYCSFLVLMRLYYEISIISGHISRSVEVIMNK